MGETKIPLKLKLTTPIFDGENEISEIIIDRKPTGAGWLDFPPTNPTIRNFMVVLQKLTAIPQPVLNKMDAEDAMSIAGDLANFLVKD